MANKICHDEASDYEVLLLLLLSVLLSVVFLLSTVLLEGAGV